jgi:type IV secretion system protein TrbL
MIYFGLLAGGNTLSPHEFADPSKLAAFGISAMTVVYNRIFAYTGWQVLYNLPDVLFSGFAATAALVAYVVLGLQVFYTLLEFYAVSSVVVVLIPWAALRQSSFLAEKAFAIVAASGVKLLVLSFIAAATLPILKRIEPGLNPTFGQIVTFAIGGVAMVGIAWRGPKLVQGLLSGSPQLSATDGVRQAQTTVQIAQQMTHALPGQAGAGSHNGSVPRGPAGAPLARRRS